MGFLNCNVLDVYGLESSFTMCTNICSNRMFMTTKQQTATHTHSLTKLLLIYAQGNWFYDEQNAP
jgi:hypothetical protein